MSKSGILLTSINTFYNEEEHRSKLMNILNKSTGISLRNLEWFITNYAKKITFHTLQKMESISLYTVHINQVSMDIVKNYLTHSVVLKSFLIKFRVHLMKSKQPWHS